MLPVPDLPEAGKARAFTLMVLSDPAYAASLEHLQSERPSSAWLGRICSWYSQLSVHRCLRACQMVRHSLVTRGASHVGVVGFHTVQASDA